MLEEISPLAQLLEALGTGAITPVQVAVASARAANGNASHNTYLYFDEGELIGQAEGLERAFADGRPRPPLFGVPISLKDCFDLAGTVTTCGARFYAETLPPATHDSAMASRLRASGALITGKTHLHSLAYGITGQNPDYGDCLQPRNPKLLTGGSSSGAAASVQEGSALAAIGTDTGGSIRVPAALCGLAGYRASHALAYAPRPVPLLDTPGTPDGLWAGAAHLAASFDTVGILLRDPRDAAPIANALFGVPIAVAPNAPRIGCVPLSFLADFTPEVLAAYTGWRNQFTLAGAIATDFDPIGWQNSSEIFSSIQAHEAAALHAGHFDRFEPAIAQRLHWGASLTSSDMAALQQRLADFRAHIARLFEQFDLLAMPCAPVRRLLAAEDHSTTRQRILRYTTPFSLAGLPAVALPGEILGTARGAGVQIAAAAGRDSTLLAFAASLAQRVVDARKSGANYDPNLDRGRQ